jgi:hypothetical protein
VVVQNTGLSPKKAPKTPARAWFCVVALLWVGGIASGLWTLSAYDNRPDLWRIATALPNVTAVRDADGLEARRFGVETSGQPLLYDHRGALIFSGGITGARGQTGGNAGQQALVALLTRGHADRRGSNVFGCPLFEAAGQRF